MWAVLMTRRLEACRSAHVLLSAWVEDTVETIMAATDLPGAGANSQADGLGITSKGFNQITSWQAYPLPSSISSIMPLSATARVKHRRKFSW